MINLEEFDAASTAEVENVWRFTYTDTTSFREWSLYIFPLSTVTYISPFKAKLSLKFAHISRDTFISILLSSHVTFKTVHHAGKPKLHKGNSIFTLHTAIT
jgi:hypothetical protein